MCSSIPRSGNAVSILLTVVRCSRTEMAQCDFIYELKERLMDGIVENILCRLEPSSLRNCELVCTTWRAAVTSGRIWKKILDDKLSADALWRKMFQRLIKFRDEDDPAFHKKMVSSVAKSVEKLDRNWRSGSSIRIPMNAEVETDPFFKISDHYLISRAYGTLGLLSDLLIFDMQMGAIQKEIHLNGNINCYDFNHNFICCGMDDGTILVIDLQTEDVLNILVDPKGRVASICLSPDLLISISGDNDPPSDISVEKEWLLTVWRVHSATDMSRQQQLSFTGDWLYVTSDDRFVVALQVKNRGDDSLAHFICTRSGRIVRSLSFDYTNDIWQYADGLFITCRREPACNVRRGNERTLRFNGAYLVCSGRSGLTKHLEIYHLRSVLDPHTSPSQCLLSTISWPEEKRYGFFRINDFYIVGLGGSGWDLDMSFHVLDFSK